MQLDIVFYIVWSIVCFAAGMLVRWIIERENGTTGITVEQALDVLKQNGWHEVKNDPEETADG